MILQEVDNWEEGIINFIEVVLVGAVGGVGKGEKGPASREKRCGKGGGKGVEK